MTMINRGIYQNGDNIPGFLLNIHTTIVPQICCNSKWKGFVLFCAKSHLNKNQIQRQQQIHNVALN